VPAKEVWDAPPVKVPSVAFAAVTAAVPVAFSRVVLFIGFAIDVIRVAALVNEVITGLVVTRVAAPRTVVVGLVRADVIVNGLVVVLRITGSVSDLVGAVRRGALMVVVLTLAVTADCGNLLACVREVRGCQATW
jgi:hypothetical protein